MSDRGDIVVRIGATLDRSFDAVLADAEKKWQRAFGAASRQGANVSASRAELEVTKQKLRLENELAKLRMRLDADQASRSRASLRQQDAHVRAHYKQIEAAHRQLETQKRAEERKTAQERAREDRTARQAEYRRAREIDRFATRTSHRATRFFFPPPEGALGYAKRTALDLARGAGVDFSLSGGVARAREREMAGMGLAQQERIATGKTQGGGFWAGISQRVGADLKVAPEQVTAMMRAFTGKTGDFDFAAKSAKDLASMTLASGANMDEMGSAAGYVYNQLKGMPDAAERTLDVMRGIVGQTAVGAVEMEEYAKQMGRIAANAKMFQGDVSRNILELSALTQLSIAEGGATSGADAARSIAAFANTTSKGQRIKAFAEHGIELFNESGTQKRPILDIIKDSLIKSKGNIPAMTKMWADTLGQKPIRGLTNAFNEAGGGEKGWQAALEKVRPFMSAQMTRETERANIADYNKTTEARAQAFQNRLDQVSARIASGVLPALERLEPYIIKAADAFAKLVEWGATNPGELIAAAIAASIARAGLESVGRLFLDRLMSGIAGNALGAGASGVLGGGGGAIGGGIAGLLGKGAGVLEAAGGGAVGAGGVAIILAATAAAAGMLTTALLESAEATTRESKSRQTRSANDIYSDFSSEYMSAKTDDERAAAKAKAKQALSQDEGSRGFLDRLFGNQDVFLGTSRAIDELASSADRRRTSEERVRDELSGMGQGGGKAIAKEDFAQAMSGALMGRTVMVRVVNSDDFNFTPASGTVPGGPPRTDWFGSGNS